MTHGPGHADEAEEALRRAVRSDDRIYVRLDGVSNRHRYAQGPGFTVLREGSHGTVIAVGPMADDTAPPKYHRRAHGLDESGIYASVHEFFDRGPV